MCYRTWHKTLQEIRQIKKIHHVKSDGEEIFSTINVEDEFFFFSKNKGNLNCPKNIDAYRQICSLLIAAKSAMCSQLASKQEIQKSSESPESTTQI